MRESMFQKKVIDAVLSMFPDGVVLKNDPNYKQGIPDLIFLIGSSWLALECKRDRFSKVQPNQEYYIEKFNGMSYAAFVYPENLSEVLNEIQCAFGA